MNLEIEKELKSFLLEHGTVETLEWFEEKKELHIKVNNMKCNAMTSFRIIGKIQEITNEEFPLMGKTNVESDHFHVIFKK